MLGGIYVGDGKVTLGNIAEFIMYLNMLTFPVSALGWAVSLHAACRPYRWSV
jgi:ATP-binding cassette subfamily B protein